MKTRLDQQLVNLGLVATRSQAESYIKLGEVKVNGRIATKAGLMVDQASRIELLIGQQYVSRAALKLASVAAMLGLDFNRRLVLDIGSSTGGFTDYALQQGASRVIAVDVGKHQLHDSLRGDPRIELHEQTDIRQLKSLSFAPDIVLADVSFISLREILPHVSGLIGKHTQLVVMVKPQFEAGESSQKHKGVIKNDRMRRTILSDFESWAKQKFLIVDKADSAVSGAKGNRERFYLLRKA